MSSRRRKPKVIGVRWSWPDGTADVLTLIELEKARLRELARLLEHPAASSEMRDRGEALLEQLAGRLAKERGQSVAQARDSAEGARVRRQVGKRKAAQVAAALAQGKDPQIFASERHVRRLKRGR